MEQLWNMIHEVIKLKNDNRNLISSKSKLKTHISTPLSKRRLFLRPLNKFIVSAEKIESIMSISCA
ncbi:hypothetical protein EO95_13905 [Methanosarcina sp. 1.H.T.1A.1]|nr:hypothetical protein EO95_13905 [Methanosarcina sp. 1.H.T.1A.1]